MRSDYENAVDMVRMGFNEDTRNLHFIVGFGLYGGGPEGALAAIRIIDQYNDFDASRVIEALQPHLGKLDYPGIRIGREGSPVIYLTVSDAKFIPEVEGAMRAAQANELDWDHLTLRAWWD